MSITLNLINHKKLAKTENSRKYSVRHKNKWYSIGESEKFNIKVAAFVGTFFFVGGLAERLTKNYYCNQLQTKLRSKDNKKHLVHLQKKIIKILENTEERVESRASRYRLTRVPASKRRVAYPVNPVTIDILKYQYRYCAKKMPEPLPPTVKAALWRRAYLCR